MTAENDYTVLSSHFLRRTARKREQEWQAVMTRAQAVRSRVRVVKARRGPYRWHVVIDSLKADVPETEF